MEHFVQAVTVRWYNACAYYAVALSRGLKCAGHRVTVAGSYDTPAVKKARELHCDVYEYPGSKLPAPLSFISRIQALRRYALENKVTLVNAHHGIDHLLWAAALRGTGIPVVRTSGNQIPPKNHAGARYLVRKKTAGIIASCSTIRGFYSDCFGIEPEKIPVIHGGVDIDHYNRTYPLDLSRKNLDIPEDAFVFGILGRFSPDKGHVNFFRAAGIVAKKYPETWFVVAGWDAQLTEKDMRIMASGAGIGERTRFTGRLQDSRDIIGLLDAGVIASVRSETVCRVAMEYMAMGVPVVATDTNVIPEIVRHGLSGLVVPAGDHKTMASAMEEICESREKARAFGQNGRAIVESDYSLSSFAKYTLDAYRSMRIRS